MPFISVGVGVNTGPASVGLMGSRNRLSYTCIGDSVTLAARLEGLTRIYGVSNCVGPDSAAAVPDGMRAVLLDLIAVKGFAAAVPVHVVLPVDLPGLDRFDTALATARRSYLARNWAGAEEALTELAQMDLPFCDTARLAALYLERIEGFYRHPPPADWDGAARAFAKR